MIRPTLLRYCCAIITIILAIVARSASDPVLGNRHPFAACYFALLITAWYGGVGPTLLAIVLGSFWSHYLFVSPRRTLLLVDGLVTLDLVLFCAVGLGLTLTVRNPRSARSGSGREVTRRERAEARRRDQEERLRATLDSIGDGVLVADAEGRVAALNPVAEGLLGFSSASPRRKPRGVRSAKCSA